MKMRTYQQFYNQDGVYRNWTNSLYSYDFSDIENDSELSNDEKQSMIGLFKDNGIARDYEHPIYIYEDNGVYGIQLLCSDPKAPTILPGPSAFKEWMDKLPNKKADAHTQRVITQIYVPTDADAGGDAVHAKLLMTLQTGFEQVNGANTSSRYGVFFNPIPPRKGEYENSITALHEHVMYAEQLVTTGCANFIAAHIKFSINDSFAGFKHRLERLFGEKLIGNAKSILQADKELRGFTDKVWQTFHETDNDSLKEKYSKLYYDYNKLMERSDKTIEKELRYKFSRQLGKEFVSRRRKDELNLKDLYKIAKHTWNPITEDISLMEQVFQAEEEGADMERGSKHAATSNLSWA